MLRTVVGALQKTWDRLPRETGEAEVPAALVRILMRSLFREVRIQLSAGADQSRIEFPGSLALPADAFTAEGVRGVFESRCVFVSFNQSQDGQPCGSIEFAMAFEEPGGGRQLMASAELVLAARDGAITYSAVDVSCSGEPALERAFTTALGGVFSLAKTREAIAGVIAAAVRQVIGWDDAVLGVRVTETALAVRRKRM